MLVLKSTERGYNSENYGYKLFTVTSTDENIGGIGEVTYSLSEFFDGTDEGPGTFDNINSVGRIIPEKHFPTFDIRLKNNQYLKGESVKTESSKGVVSGWNPKTGILRVSSRDNFYANDIIVGSTSKTNGLIKNVESPRSYINLSSTSTVTDGLQVKSGFLNEKYSKDTR